jgi:hypothetical protein
MYGPLKPANDTVYVKFDRMMPPGIVGVQFGLGHVCCARNCCCVGAVTESVGTVSLPFFGESRPVLFEAVKVPWCCESDGFPPPLMHTTVAVYVTLRFAVALVLPTPASSNELHETFRPLTVQLGEPVWTWVPVGAFAGLKVVFWLAEATAVENAKTAANGTARRNRIRRIVTVSPLTQSGADMPSRCTLVRLPVTPVRERMGTMK